MVLRSLLGADMMFRPDRDKEKESEKPARLRKREKTTCLRGRTQLYSLAEALRSAAMEGKAVAMTKGERRSGSVDVFRCKVLTRLVKSGEEEAKDEPATKRRGEVNFLVRALLREGRIEE